MLYFEIHSNDEYVSVAFFLDFSFSTPQYTSTIAGVMDTYKLPLNYTPNTFDGLPLSLYFPALM